MIPCLFPFSVRLSAISLLIFIYSSLYCASISPCCLSWAQYGVICLWLVPNISFEELSFSRIKLIKNERG